MLWNLLPALGGIGQFLIGMLLMRDGLKALAGAVARDFGPVHADPFYRGGVLHAEACNMRKVKEVS